MMLLANEVYTFKVQRGDLFSFKNETEIKQRVALLLDGIANVHSVDKAMNAYNQDNYIRLTPIENIEAVKVVNLVRDAFNQLGFENAAVLSYERGESEGKNFMETGLKDLGDFITGIVRWLALGIAVGIVVYLIIRRAKA